MTNLSEHTDPARLVPGDPGAIREFVGQINVLSSGLDSAATHLASIEAGAWRGEAGDLFRVILRKQPDNFRRAADAYGSAAGACLSYAAALERAQLLARSAVERYREGRDLTARWQRRVDDYNDLRLRAALGDPAAARVFACTQPPPSDPGAHVRAEAERLLHDARCHAEIEARRAASTLDEAKRSAPKKPGIFKRIARSVGEFVGGARDSLYEMNELAAQFHPLRLVIDPFGYLLDVQMLGAGVVHGVTHPLEFAEAIIDWETFQQSPERWLGRLVPDIALALATGGASKAVTTSARTATKVGKAQKLLKAVRDGATPGVVDVVMGADNLAKDDAVRSIVRSANFDFSEASPARDAWLRQQARTPGRVDEWVNSELQAGDRIAVLGSAATPSRAIVVPASEADRLGTSSERWYAATQTTPDRQPVRAGVQVFELSWRIDIAAARANAAPELGAGGAVRIHIPHLQALIDRGGLTLVEERPLDEAPMATAGRAPLSATGR